jgi:hypothetical protein
MSSLEQRLATITNRAAHLNLQLSELNRLRGRASGTIGPEIARRTARFVFGSRAALSKPATQTLGFAPALISPAT